MLQTFGDAFELFLFDNKIGIQDAAAKMEIQPRALNKQIAKLKNQEGDLSSFIANCNAIGVNVDFIFTNQDSKENIQLQGSTAGHLLSKIILIHKIKISEILGKLEISDSAYHRRLRVLSENKGQIRLLVELANSLGYDIEVKLTKTQ